MKKKNSAVVIGAVLALLVLVLFIWPKIEWSRQMQSRDHQVYHGSQPYLDISFQYPRDWRVMEDKGKIDAYTQAMVLGPRNLDDTYTASFIVRGSPLKSKQGRFENVEQLKQNYLTHLYKNPRLLDQSAAKVQNRTAEDVMVMYTIPPAHHIGLKSKEIPVKAKALFTQNGDYFYEFIYSADEREFEKHLDEFKYLLKSIRFENMP